MKREELIRSREYWVSEIQLNLFNLIENFRKENNLTKSDLAKKLGVTKGYITQILNGDYDHKISKLVDLALSFNKVPIITYLDLDQFIKDDALGKTHLLNPHLRPLEFINNIVIHVNSNEAPSISINDYDKTETDVKVSNEVNFTRTHYNQPNYHREISNT